MKITEVVTESHRVLDEAGIRHAIGGAIALAYHGRPRSTMDVDINVSAPHTDALAVSTLFSAIGFEPDGPVEGRLPVAGVPLSQADGGATIDLFFALDEGYRGFVDRSIVVPFGSAGTEIPILCADDLVLFKVSAGRPRDWIDLEDLLATETVLDLDTIEVRLIEFRGAGMYRRLARLRSLVRKVRG